MSSLNIAVLSTAHIHSRGFLENLAKATDGRKALVIWDDVPDRGKRYATDFKSRFEPDLKQVLADPAVDGFAIFAENTRHTPLLEQTLALGKPIFCEKPLITSAADALAIARLATRHQARLCCGYFQPFSDVMQQVRHLLDSGEFGTITRVKFRNAHHAAYGRWFDNPDLNWFYKPELSGGGALMDMGAHAVHLLRTLFGPIKEVWAVIENHSGEYPLADDYGMIQMRFANGILGTAEAAWTQTGGIGGMEIVGAKKTLWNDGNGYVIGGPGIKAEPVLSASERPAGMDRLIAMIQGRLTVEEMSSDLLACLDEAAIMDAAYRAAKTGTWTPVTGVRL
jgi:predicted dehydrogenase